MKCKVDDSRLLSFTYITHFTKKCKNDWENNFVRWTRNVSKLTIVPGVLILYNIRKHIFLNDARVNQIKDKLSNNTKILLIAGKKNATRETCVIFIPFGFSFFSYERRLAWKTDIGFLIYFVKKKKKKNATDKQCKKCIDKVIDF